MGIVPSKDYTIVSNYRTYTFRLILIQIRFVWTTTIWPEAFQSHFVPTSTLTFLLSMQTVLNYHVLVAIIAVRTESQSAHVPTKTLSRFFAYREEATHINTRVFWIKRFALQLFLTSIVCNTIAYPPPIFWILSTNIKFSWQNH